MALICKLVLSRHTHTHTNDCRWPAARVGGPHFICLPRGAGCWPLFRRLRSGKLLEKKFAQDQEKIMS